MEYNEEFQDPYAYLCTEMSTQIAEHRLRLEEWMRSICTIYEQYDDNNDNGDGTKPRKRKRKRKHHQHRQNKLVWLLYLADPVDIVVRLDDTLAGGIVRALEVDVCITLRDFCQRWQQQPGRQTWFIVPFLRAACGTTVTKQTTKKMKKQRRGTIEHKTIQPALSSSSSPSLRSPASPSYYVPSYASSLSTTAAAAATASIATDDGGMKQMDILLSFFRSLANNIDHCHAQTGLQQHRQNCHGVSNDSDGCALSDFMQRALHAFGGITKECIDQLIDLQTTIKI